MCVQTVSSRWMQDRFSVTLFSLRLLSEVVLRWFFGCKCNFLLLNEENGNEGTIISVLILKANFLHLKTQSATHELTWRNECRITRSTTKHLVVQWVINFNRVIF
jgi:hypothetical protein